MSESLKDFLEKKDTKYNPEVKKVIDKLPMSINEILHNYGQSDMKASDIERLADLNGCAKGLIREIIKTELGESVLPKQGRTVKKTKNLSESKVPAKTKKTKEIVSCFVLQAVQDKMDIVNSELADLTRELFVKEQRKEELEKAYMELVGFMETHKEEE